MILAIANQKGGVAKTTTTHNLAAALSKAGKQVLMVDLDPQASLTICTGIENPQHNIADILRKNPQANLADITVKLSENLHIVPSAIELAALEMEMLSRPAREKILDRSLASVRKNYDFILIDCPPQLSCLTLNALSCATHVLIPVKTDYLAYRGLTALLDTIAEVKEYINPNLELLGVVATFFEFCVKDDNEILSLLVKQNRLLGTVKKRAAAKKGIYDGKSAVEQDEKSDIAKEYTRLAQMLTKIEVKK